MSDPPRYGFRPEYSPESTPGAPQYPPQHYSGVDLSYPMPMPGGNYNMPRVPPPPMRRVSVSSSSSSSSNEDSADSYRLDYTQYPPVGHAWQRFYSYDGFPYVNAIRAGRDQDGTTIYVGRAYHEGDLIPAKIIPEKQAAYVSFNGEEILKTEFEVLRKGELEWEFATGGEIPPAAVEAGRTGDGEILYVGRALYEGSQTPGKVQPSHGCLYIAFDGREIPIREYEVLCVR